MSPLDGDAKPRPKSASLARGQRRYRRKVASPKEWQAIRAEKLDGQPCRVCGSAVRKLGWTLEPHHLVKRAHGGDDIADNIVPVHRDCHVNIEMRVPRTCAWMLANLTDAEYAYMIARGGEDYAERAYGVQYTRP